jgi:hypothetical protein
LFTILVYFDRVSVGIAKDNNVTVEVVTICHRAIPRYSKEWFFVL